MLRSVFWKMSVTQLSRLFWCFVIYNAFLIDQTIAAGLFTRQRSNHATESQLMRSERTDLAWRKASTATQVQQIDSHEIDLTTHLKNSIGARSNVYSKAIALLVQMQAAPSCRRLAATDLMTDCRSVEGAAASTLPNLDDVKEIYAARLAVCELQRADVEVPSQCNFFSHLDTENPSKVNAKTTSFLLRPCLKSLESKPQWWTSYSNARQETEVMCQASRIEIEKGWKVWAGCELHC